MPDVLTFVRRLRGSLRSSAFEASMEAELQVHLALETELLVARGMDPCEARLAARERFGSVAQVKDECRDSWRMRAIDVVSQDIRFGMRSLRTSPAYTAVVLLTLALGIGANTAIFSAVHSVLLHPLPYAHGDRLVELRQQTPRLGIDSAGLSVKEIADYRSHTGSLDAVVEYHQMSFNLLGRGDAARVRTGVVSTDFFDVLGVAPMLGRTFNAADDSKDAPAVLILSHSLMTRVGAALLFAVEPTDPLTYAAVMATLACVGALACLGPASRAATIDPMLALRTD